MSVCATISDAKIGEGCDSYKVHCKIVISWELSLSPLVVGESGLLTMS